MPTSCALQISDLSNISNESKQNSIHSCYIFMPLSNGSELQKHNKVDTAKFRRDLLEVQSELQRFAYKLTADKEEANDLLQETSLKALANMDKYTPDTNFKGWVYTIMRNIFINNYRKEIRDQTFVDHTDNLFHINQPHELENYTTENNYDSKEIYRVVHSLPREYRIPFLMHISGFKYREIAEKLGLPRLLKDYK